MKKMTEKLNNELAAIITAAKNGEEYRFYEKRSILRDAIKNFPDIREYFDVLVEEGICAVEETAQKWNMEIAVSDDGYFCSRSLTAGQRNALWPKKFQGTATPDVYDFIYALWGYCPEDTVEGFYLDCIIKAIKTKYAPEIDPARIKKFVVLRFSQNCDISRPAGAKGSWSSSTGATLVEGYVVLKSGGHYRSTTSRELVVLKTIKRLPTTAKYGNSNQFIDWEEYKQELKKIGQENARKILEKRAAEKAAAEKEAAEKAAVVNTAHLGQFKKGINPLYLTDNFVRYNLADGSQPYPDWDMETTFLYLKKIENKYVNMLLGILTRNGINNFVLIPLKKGAEFWLATITSEDENWGSKTQILAALKKAGF